MADVLELTFKPENGKIPTAVLHPLIDAVSKMDGKRLIMTLKEQKRRRSRNQNNYYFGVLVKRLTVAFREHGNDMDEEEVHEFLKNAVGKLKRFAVLPDGEVVTIKGSTKRLTTMEFEVYVEKVRACAATMGIPLPLPNEDLPG